MTTKKLMFGAAIAATIALVFPAQALATVTTTDITASGTSTVKTTMQANDLIDVTATAPNDFDVSAQVSREVTRSSLGFKWSGESLQLRTANDIVSPDGWDLEYTTNGNTWVSTKPTDYTSITGVRTTGDYTKTNLHDFQSSTTAILMATATDFTGGVGGDGFNLTFVGDRVYNVYHHADRIYLDCHLKATGSTCYGAPKQFLGYETPNSAHAWANAAGTKLFVPSYNLSATDSGIACIDLSNRINPVLCSGATNAAFSPFISLGNNVNRQNMAGAAQVGEKLYMPSPYDWKLDCFDMATGLECTGNGYVTGGVALSATVNRTTGPWTVYGRANNIGGKVFWSTDTYLGCYDPATGGFCGGNAPVAIGASIVSTTGNYSNVIASENLPFQFPMFAVRNAGGTVTGACYFASAQCFTTAGAVDNTLLPTALKGWMKEHPLPKWVTSDSGQYGEYDNKIYFPVGPSTTATASVYCFDFTTSAACASFGTNGTKTGVNSELYSIQVDPDPLQPNCMWTNSNSGHIVTFNATTGEAGCANASSTVKLPYNQILPRMACAESARISAWGKVTFHSPGISASVLRVTVNDTAGNPITGFNDVPITVDPNSSIDGTLDLSSIPVSTSGTKPTILVTAVISVAGSLLSQITANVGFTASEPQLCLILKAKIKCATAYTSPTGPTSVGDGLVTTLASYTTTRYDAANTATTFASVTETIPQTITGTGTAVCPASAGGGGGGSGTVTQTPVVTPPKTKRPPVTITIGGFRDGSPILTKTIQNKIKAFLKKYNDYPVIETAGFTEGPVVLKTDYALSKARAVNATSFIRTKLKKSFSVVKIKSGQDKVEASKVRRIKITLTDE